VIVRALTPEEYPILRDFPGGFVPNTANSIALVSFDGDKPIGRMLLVTMVHIEGTFVQESYRKTTIGYRMLKEAEHQAKNAGLKTVMAYVPTQEVADYLARLGYQQMPVTVWSKEL
jgi:GNAT superfamily N-acetyltransferase